MWPDYDKENLQIDKVETWEVYDPWMAQVVGVFYSAEEAKLFRKSLIKKWRKKQS